MLVSLSVVFTLVQSTGAQPAAGASRATPPIPRSVLFGNPDRSSPQISPDGSWLAFLAPVDGVMNVWVAPTQDLSKARAVTLERKRGIRQYQWAFTNQHILYAQDKDGDENWRVYCVDLTSDQTRDLTPFANTQARIESVSHRAPDEILVALNNRNPKFHDIYKIQISTGERKLLRENSEFSSFISDDNHKLRFANKSTGDGGTEIVQLSETGKIEPFLKIPAQDAMNTNTAGFDKTGNVLLMRDSRDRNTAALVALDLNSGATSVLAEDPRVDVGMLARHPTDNTVQAVLLNWQRREWKVLDDGVRVDFDILGKLEDSEFMIPSRTLDDQKWIVSCSVDNGPTRFYLYDRLSKKAQFLFSSQKDLEQYKLARMHPIVIRSRDEMELVSYLSLPPDSDPNNDGRPDRPVPMVLSVHGGPWGRDMWGYNATHQWLADRGYAVLSVNFRGSTGFGKAFVNAADHEWAGKMHDDLIDAVNWAVAEKIAQPDKIAIMGGSYGGYATLVGLTFTPKIFACGVDLVGPSSLVTLLNTVPPYWLPAIDRWKTRVGDHETEDGRAFLLSRSPLTRVDQISRPLLIGHGANDPRVKRSESDQIVKAMQQKQIPVTYVLYSDEGHGFARPPNRMSFNAVAEAFLAQHLGGRFEPIGDDFADSTISVPAGAENISGLSEKLPLAK